jgi:gas vesicle protein
MYYDEESTAVSFLSGLIVGAAIGAGLALLLAPQSGKRTRRQLMRSVEGWGEQATDRWEDVASDVRTKVRGGRRKKFSF